jgi:hypothetical protein
MTLAAQEPEQCGMRHGKSGHCHKCGACGRFEQGNDVDGPEHSDWIGRKSCHECHGKEG